MIQGPMLLAILLIGIILIVVMISRLKIHAFISLLVVAYGISFAAGMPAADIARTITEGFGGLLTNIGIVIVLGTIIGTFLEKSGAALKMAERVVRWVGYKHPALAMSIIGYIVSIPVFCDSGFVIISPLRKALQKRTKTSSVAMTIALSTGLYATHTLVPPTPGPIAAAANLGMSHNLLLVIVLGMVVALPAAFSGYLYATWLGRRITTEEDAGKAKQSYKNLLQSDGKLPNAWLSFSPIVVPIILMALGSVAKFPGDPLGTGIFKTGMVFLGVPVNALFVGFFCSLALVPKLDEMILTGWINESLKAASVIILVTGAGGSLGAVLKATNIGAYLGQSLAAFNIGILLPFIIAAAIKTAQGSSTVAMVTTSTIVAPLLANLNLDSEMGRALAVMAIGAGSMVVSHANDSYFWIISQFGGIKVNDAYKSQTMGTLIEGLSTMAFIYILSLILI